MTRVLEESIDELSSELSFSSQFKDIVFERVVIKGSSIVAISVRFDSIETLTFDSVLIKDMKISHSRLFNVNNTAKLVIRNLLIVNCVFDNASTLFEITNTNTIVFDHISLINSTFSSGSKAFSISASSNFTATNLFFTGNS